MKVENGVTVGRSILGVTERAAVRELETLE